MILVTGGAGYIGSHCVLALIKSGEDVVIFDSLELGHIEIIHTLKSYKAKGNIVDFIQGDLKNQPDIAQVFNKHKIDAVVHFAAYSQVCESVQDPQKYYLNNVSGSLNLFSEMLKNKVDKIVFSSTAAIYGEPDYIPIDENHKQNPINPYGQSKLMVENILDDYDKAYGLKNVRLRYFNVAGADSENLIGEWHESETHLVPNILKSTFDDAKTFKLYGDDYNTIDGTCIRDYINVEDLAQAHLLALNYLLNGGKTNYFNLGTNHGNTVKEVFRACEKITNQPIPLDIEQRREGDPESLIADNKKAKDILGWQPDKTLDYSIKTAYAWEKTLQSGLMSQFSDIQTSCF